jgi:predicted amidohydrolase
MKIAAVQHDIVWENADATRQLLVPQIAQAAGSGAGLVVLSEMYATGFSMSPERIAEEPGGPNEQFLIEQAARHQLWLIGSIAQWSDADPAPASSAASRRAANVAVVAGPSAELFRYRKIHPFSYAGEHEHYDSGTDFLTVQIGDLRVTVFICYDLRFADEFWASALATDLYVVPANWPEPRREHWRALLRARAIENQAYVLGCNRVGTVESDDPAGTGPRRTLNHTGDSAIIDPLGRTLAEASRTEAVLVVEADPGEVKRVRDRFPFLADRR